MAGFPAGTGLYAPCGWAHDAQVPAFPHGGLMLIGNHLDSEENWQRVLKAGEAPGDPCAGAPRMRFWSILYRLLDEAGIKREAIFVTNIHPALVRGSRKTGVVRGSPEWRAQCATLLDNQIEVMQPTVVAAMGNPAQRFVSDMLGFRWQSAPDAVEVEVDGRQIAAVAMRHPSSSQSLEMRRRTGRLLGDALPTKWRDRARLGDVVAVWHRRVNDTTAESR